MTLNLFAVGLLFVFVGNLISELLNPPKKLAMIRAMLAIIMRIQTIKMRNQNKKKRVTFQIDCDVPVVPAFYPVYPQVPEPVPKK